jgi:hypothetical protein
MEEGVTFLAIYEGACRSSHGQTGMHGRAKKNAAPILAECVMSHACMVIQLKRGQ